MNVKLTETYWYDAETSDYLLDWEKPNNGGCFHKTPYEEHWDGNVLWPVSAMGEIVELLGARWRIERMADNSILLPSGAIGVFVSKLHSTGPSLDTH